MTTQSTRLLQEAMQSLSFGSISGTYALVGETANPSQVYFVQNLTNATITFSQDGINDTFQLPTQGFLLIDAGTNHGTAGYSSFQAGTPLYAKGTPGSGQVNLTTWYLG
ncbi:MAG: hypothetical protein KGZ39_00265 [Simkania sp.]|nr:hypothetical protein [Simkania sp.]